jgi:hypothetical protein
MHTHLEWFTPKIDRIEAGAQTEPCPGWGFLARGARKSSGLSDPHGRVLIGVMRAAMISTLDADMIS